LDVQKADRLNRLPRFALTETRRRVREARERGVDVISLGVGDPDQPTPPHVVAALVRAAADQSTRGYPTGEVRGMPAFREAVAARYATRYGVALDPATEVMALLGSKEGNHHVAMALLDPGDAALVPDPSFPAYAPNALLAGASVETVPLRAERDYLIDFDGIPADVAAQARILWLNYPNNPTAAVAPLDFYATAVEFARRNEVLLISDNPYSEIAFDGVVPPSILEVEGAKDVAIEFNSLSKTYNMAGFRIGMAVGNPDVVGAIAQVKENVDSGMFDAIQYAGIAALEGPQDVIEQNAVAYGRRRAVAIDGLRAAGLWTSTPQATFYVWARIPAGISSAEFAESLFDLTGVVVIPGPAYGVQGEGYIRISLAVADDRLHEAMDRLVAVSDRLEPIAVAH
jgi:LL-diaminopimelate aminotransferase